MFALAIFLGDQLLLPIAMAQIYFYLDTQLSSTYFRYASNIIQFLMNSVQALAIALLLYGLFVKNKQISVSKERIKSILENDSEL